MELQCKKCGSHDLHAHATGFNGSKAIVGFAVCVVVLGTIWAAIINDESRRQVVDRVENNLLFISLSSVLPFLCLFFGCEGMNKIMMTCLKCGAQYEPGNGYIEEESINIAA